MTVADWENLWQQLPRLQAEQNLTLATISAYPHMKESGQRKMWQAWQGIIASTKSGVVGAGQSVAESVRAVRRLLRRHGQLDAD